MTARLLLCTDLDRTLVPNGPEPESEGARELFRRLTARSEFCLAYVSGRDALRVADAIEQFALPMPDYVIADVGTSIYDLNLGNDWARNHAWDAAIGGDWGNDGAKRLTQALGSVSFISLQEPSKQGRFKLSFYVPQEIPQSHVSAMVDKALSHLDIPVTLIYSVDEPNRVALLDVLPARANKLHAITFLMQALDYANEQTVFCGDSGNDLSVLASRVPGVLVANASALVRNQALELAAQADLSRHLYTAHGDFMNMNGNYAAGIIEGVCHFHPYVVGWMVNGQPHA